MCGFAGFLEPGADRSSDETILLVKSMGDALAHRGPDDQGTWIDNSAGIALAHRRLAIVDLSPLGHQPMASACGRFHIAFNGEIYNFLELRAALEGQGVPFQSKTDTEVILSGCATWGVDATVRKLSGMFSFALWDAKTRTLYLVRDRLGIKPLYWGTRGKLVLFGSELKALLRHRGWNPEIDRDALSSFLRYAYVPAPRSIWQGIYKLQPGRILAITEDGTRHETVYWSAEQVACSGILQRNHCAIDEQEAAEALELVLARSVSRHMMADVPLGAFLSGGYDSTAVVALMQRHTSRPVKTFTIGFHEQGYNEAEHAKAVAGHLGTEHTELYVDPSHAIDIIPQLPDWYDEPFADSSQIPTFLLSRMTREHVTVALSGDGGDELFAGYNRYAFANSLWSKMRRVPRGVRRGIAAGIRGVSPSAWDRIASILPAALSRPQIGDKLHKLASILGESEDSLYRRLVSQWTNPNDIVNNATELSDPHGTRSLKQLVPDFTDRMQLLDLLTYLPDDILTKVDRASMAVSLEVRVPLLDPEVVEFAWNLPQQVKISGDRGKLLLRRMVHRHVPRSLMDRPKMGFGIPIDHWLRGPLRDWAEDLLSERALGQDGLLNPAPIRQVWAQHLAGTHNWQYPLWTALMFQAWRRRWETP